MKLISNLKISQKVLGLLGLMILFIITVGLVGFFSAKIIASGSNTMYKDRLIPLKQLNENLTHVRANEANLLWLILAQDSKTQQKYLNDIKIRAERFNKNLADYEKTKLDPLEQENLPKLKNSLAEYRAVRAKVIDLATHGKNKDGYNYFLKNIRSFENASKYSIILAEYNAKVANNVNKQNIKTQFWSTVIIITTIIIAVSVALIIGLAISGSITNPVKTMLEKVQEVAKGNLAIDNADYPSKDEIGELGRAFNVMTDNLKNLVTQVSRSVEDISAGSEEMSAAADQTAQGAQQVATSVQQLAAGSQQVSQNIETGAADIGKMNKIIQEISEEASNIAKLGDETETNANEGRGHVKKAVGKIGSIKQVSGEISGTISELGKLSSEIEQIVDLIKNIAGQTNLLALNAAIEAARAGEHGKGFAVVADEVKKLAGQSGEATDKITAMIKEIQDKTQVAVATMGKASDEVEEGVTVIHDAGKALENVIDQVKQANSKIQCITKEIDHVAKSSDEIVRMVENISSVVEESAASAEEIASITEEQTASLEEINASSQTLARIAENLNKQVAVFKI